MQNNTPTLYENERPSTIKAWRNDVYEELELAGLNKIAKRWLSCSENCFTRIKPVEGASLPRSAKRIFVCIDDHTHEAEIYSQTCDLRICPECARRHSARMVARYLPKMLELLHQHHPTHRFRHIVFTLPFGLEDPDIRQKLLDGFAQVERVMDALMTPAGDWKASQGFLTGSEFGETGYKLHFHVIHYGQYLNQVDLSREWSKQTRGAAQVVFVRGFPYKGKTIEESLREVLKYATKFYSKDEITGEVKYIPAKLLPVLAKVLEKTRRIRTYGVFYDVPEPDRDTHTCATCNSPMVGIPLDYWTTFVATGFLPLEWKLQAGGAGLHLKPADNSHSLTSGLAPPDSQNIRQKQMLMAQIEKIRIQRKDDW